jgi:hypothetical protein
MCTHLFALYVYTGGMLAVLLATVGKEGLDAKALWDFTTGHSNGRRSAPHGYAHLHAC